MKTKTFPIAQIGNLAYRRLSIGEPPFRVAQSFRHQIKKLGTVAILGLVFSAQAASLQITIEQPNSINESNRAFVLTWDAVPGTTYQVQHTLSLSPPVSWTTLDAVVADSATQSLKIRGRSIPENSIDFFRLQTQPAILAVEPAVVAPGTAVDFYVVGQGFNPDDVLKINGEPQTNVVFNGPTLLTRPTFTPSTPGVYVFQLVVSDQVVSSFSVTCADASSAPGLVLQGPPEEPPAGTCKTATNRKGISISVYDAAARGGGVGINEPMPDTDMHTARNIAAVLNGNTVIGARRAPAAEPRAGGLLSSVCLPTGELQGEATDLAIPGRGLDFVWTRTYRSRTGPSTSQGVGWDFSYNASVELQPDGTVLLRPGNGRADAFYPNGSNSWARNEYFLEIRDLDGDGRPDVVAFADGGQWLFNPLVGSSAPGKLWKIVDRNANTITLVYDDVSGLLVAIVDDLDRTNSVSYNGAGQISAITDFSGRTVRYEYNSSGDLVACVSPAVTGTPTGNDFPGGITNRYTYTSGNTDERLNHNLTSCIDGKGQTWLQVSYQATTDPASLDFDAVDYVARGTDVEYLRRYAQTPTPANGYASMKAITRDAERNVAESFYDPRLRCVRLLEYTGRAPDGTAPTTETGNRPAGKLREGDPDLYETKWTWNADSLCMTETLPDGERARMMYERDFDPNATPRKKGDCRVVREYATSLVDTDGDGVGDTSEFTWYFDYDPNFGSPPTGAYVTKRNAITATQQNEAAAMKALVETAVARHMRERLNELETRLLDFGLLARCGRGPRQSISLDGSFAEGRKGWDGTIKGTPYSYSDMTGIGLRKGWDGTIKGVSYSYSDMTGIGLRKGWDGTIKGSSCSAEKVYDPLKQYMIGDTAIYNGRKFRPGRPAFGTITSRTGFIIAATDPRGNEVDAEYDSHGNRVKVRFPWLPNSQEDFAYNTYGQLTTITNAPDGNGRRRLDTIEYYETGAQSGWIKIRDTDSAPDDGFQLRTTYEYDSVGNVTRIIDPRGFDSLFTWNALNELVRCQTPTNINSRCTTDFIHDECGNVTECHTELRDANDALTYGHVVLIGHDFQDRIVSIAQQVSTNHFITNVVEYDGNSQLTAIRSPMAVTGADPHNYVAVEHDERGLLFRKIEAPGTDGALTNEYSYDSNGQLASSAKIGLKLTKSGTYLVHVRASVDRVTDAMSNAVIYAYDRNDNLILARVLGELKDSTGDAANVRMREWRGTYDKLDRLVESREAFFDPATQISIGDGLSLTTFAYAPNGACLSSTDDNGHTTAYAYDNAGRLSSVTDPGANIFQLSYDACDNLISLVSIEKSELTPPEQHFTRTYSYDSQSRRIRAVDNVGNTNSAALDSLSRIVSETDGNGTASFYSYDDLGRLTLAVADFDRDLHPDIALDVNRSWTYDDNSRCISSTDDNSNTSIYAYDAMDRLVQQTQADGTACSLIWSPRSNLLRHQDANGTVVSNSFDLLDRCVSRVIIPGQGVATTTTFEQFAYDGFSRIVAATNDAAFTIIGYDSLGNPGPKNDRGLITSCTYDGVGNLLSMTYPSTRVVTYTYNVVDNLSSVSSPLIDGAPPVLLASFAYEGPGRVGRIQRANGVATRVVWDGLVTPSNATSDFGWRQVSGVNHQIAGGGAVIDRRIAAFDRNQNRILRAQTVPFSALGDTTTNIFAYDPLNRLHQAENLRGTALRDVSYQLDGNGNRQVVTSNGVAQPYSMDNTPLPGPADFQMDQYTETPFGSQTYDDNGNLTARNSSSLQLQYQYDYANRLVAVNDLTSGSVEPVASYAYDALGRRISKTVYPPAPLGPVTTDFVHGGDPKDDDCDGRSDDIVETRVAGDLVDSFIHQQDDGITIYSVRHSGGSHFYHYDDLGNVLALTDGAGSVIEHYDYDDFGQPHFLTSDGVEIATNASPADNPFLFRNMEWDSETGFYFAAKGNPCGIAGPGIFDPGTGQGTRRGASKRDPDSLVFNVLNPRAERNNPWTGGHAGGGSGGCGGTYSEKSRDYLYSKFEDGEIPSGDDFKALIDSSLNLNDDRQLLGLRLQPLGGGILVHGKVTRQVLKSFFERGDKPTAQQLSKVKGGGGTAIGQFNGPAGVR